MKITSAEFIKSAAGPRDFPSDGLPQIALAGRSNVGKSSLINAVTGKKGLARTSSTPGRTRTINYYLINKEFYLVDLPGYGYAKVPASEKKGWKDMIESVFLDNPALKGVLIILDPRRDAGDMEEDLYLWLRSMDVAAVTVFTKCDKFSRGALMARIRALSGTLVNDQAICFSAVDGTGKKELGKRIFEIAGGG